MNEQAKQIVQDRIILWTDVYDSAQRTKTTRLFKRDKQQAELAMSRARMMLNELNYIISKFE